MDNKNVGPLSSISPLDRRRFLRLVYQGTLLTATGTGILSLAGCGGGGGGSSSSGTGSSVGPQPGGTNLNLSTSNTAVDTVGGQAVTRLATLLNVNGNNGNFWGVNAGSSTTVTQSVAWTGDPKTAARVLFDSQSRPTQIMPRNYKHFLTLDWTNPNSVLLRLHAPDRTILAATALSPSANGYTISPQVRLGAYTQAIAQYPLALPHSTAVSSHSILSSFVPLFNQFAANNPQWFQTLVKDAAAGAVTGALFGTAYGAIPGTIIGASAGVLFAILDMVQTVQNTTLSDLNQLSSSDGPPSDTPSDTGYQTYASDPADDSDAPTNVGSADDTFGDPTTSGDSVYAYDSSGDTSSFADDSSS